MKNEIKRGVCEKVKITYKDGNSFVLKKGVSIEFFSYYLSEHNFILKIEKNKENKEAINKIIDKVIKKVDNLFNIVITSNSEEVLKSKLFENYEYFFKAVEFPPPGGKRLYSFFSENMLDERIKESAKQYDGRRVVCEFKKEVK